jgi:hypothetical protein
MFIENTGQTDTSVRFQIYSSNAVIHLTEEAVWLNISESVKTDEVDAAPLLPSLQIENSAKDTLAKTEIQNRKSVNFRLSFVGANPHPPLEPINRLETHVSYFIGNNPKNWRTDVPVWGGVRYVNLYPGMDLELTGADGQWAWRLVVHDSAVTNAKSYSPLQNVRLRVDGADALTLDDDRLHLTTTLGEFTLPLLQAVTTDGIPLDLLAAQPTLDGTEIVAPFSTNHNQHLAIANQQSGASDLFYSTFLGGSDVDCPGGCNISIAVDDTGNAYVVGTTMSSDFPTTAGAFDTNHNEIYVVKVNSTGTGLAYATFLGGSDTEGSPSIAVDGAGNAYVTGYTQSSDFPTTAGAFDTSFNGVGDAFVAKLNPAGTGLIYATFLGGSNADGGDAGNAIAVDNAGNAYIAIPTL